MERTPHRLASWASALASALVLAAVPAPATAQGNIRDFKSKGIDLYEAGRYANAAEALRTYREYKPGDEEVLYPLGKSLFELNDLAGARTLLEGLQRATRKYPEELELVLARIDHHEGNFAEAARHYKRYLATLDEDDPAFRILVEDIRRVGNGTRRHSKSGAVAAYAENLGSGINSAGEEFRPVLSPNYQDRMYFASIRESTTGGRRTAEGARDPERGYLRSDMYTSRVEGGRWTAGEPLSSLLNTPDYEVPLDLTRGGKVLLFWQGATLYSGDVLADTFRSELEDRVADPPPWGNSPMRTHLGDKDPHLLNDSTLVFASAREGGQGGFDLWGSRRRAGVWTAPENLGPRVNSAFDERSPFLAADGRTLYFSTNRSDLSVGGFDVLRTRFDDLRLEWSPPEPMPPSINGAGDELNFRLARNGLEGYFDSDAKATSQGGRDLYAAYFRDELSEQTALASDTYLDVLAELRALSAASDSTAATLAAARPKIPLEVELEALPYSSDDNVVTAPNLARAASAVQLLEAYPASRLVITVHSDDSDPERFRSYFGAKRAVGLVDYLAGRGIDPSRVQIFATGAEYPIASNLSDGRPSAAGRGFNRRIELRVIPGADYDLTATYDDPRVPDYLQQRDYEYYRGLQVGVIFRVELAALPQIFDNQAWLGLPAPSVQREGSGPPYRYTVGAYPTYAEAAKLARGLSGREFPDARVVAYIDGWRVAPAEVARFAATYPELANYLAGEPTGD